MQFLFAKRVRIVTQILLAASVVTLAAFLELPWFAIGALTLLSGFACAVGLRGDAHRWIAFAAWMCTLAVWISIVTSPDAAFVSDSFLAAISCATGIVLLMAAASVPTGTGRAHWLLLGVVWVGIGALTLSFVGYLLNSPKTFYFGLLVTFVLIICAKRVFRMPAALVLCANTLILFLIGLPVVDLIIRPSYELSEEPNARAQLYSYRKAKENPAAFARWWNYFVTEWRRTQTNICMPDTNDVAPFLLRPGSDGEMFESRIHINRLGFRGPEILPEKGNAYRIVVLGESTTFGHTMYEEDVPWPRLLEKLITNASKSRRKVQVINAGIPSYTLRLNLRRLHHRILALKPDMIISYHGYNGFNWLIPTLPPVTGEPPPEYMERPVKLLADCEYSLKVLLYRRRFTSTLVATQDAPIELDDNEYTRGYRELIDVARTNGIDLVLANYSMAVNSGSDLDVIAFYRSGFPNVFSQIRANELHSQIVETLARKNPDIIFVDTHPMLDGQFDNFIDLVHFTQEGREKMARMMFTAIEPVLKSELNETIHVN